MAAIYARWIRSGLLTLDKVPEKWRSQVEELLAE
jgi:hypothetical protein